jgi:hypothetical protein
MKRILKLTAVILCSGALLGLGASCEVQRAASFSVSHERANECQRICYDLGMRLSAMVVMMNSAGCVCEPPQQRAAAPTGGASAAAGGSTIAATVAANAAAAAAVQTQQRQQQAQHY